MQEAKDAIKCAKEYNAMCKDILNELKRKNLKNDDKSVGAQLLRVVDPWTGMNTLASVVDITS